MAEEVTAAGPTAPSETVPAAEPTQKLTEQSQSTRVVPLAPADDGSATEAPASADPNGTESISAVDKPTVEASGTAEPKDDSAAAPASAKKPQKRKSVGGTPAKKLKGKKSMPDLHLNVQPGDYWYVQMKGYPPWPAIVCDEEMLPESLLSKRPVSAMRVDGTYREDFQDAGKNARDRRYPVMFLGTNEFAWQVNTDLVPLDVDDVKGIVERNEQGKKTKALWQAYQIAAEDHDLDHFKQMLQEHEMHVMQEQERLLEEETKRQERMAEKETEKVTKKDKKEKKEKKPKVSVDEDGDVEMEDGDEAGEQKKAAKKRKKSTGDAEGKTKIVLKGLKTSEEDEQPKPKKPRKSKPPTDREDSAAKVATPTPPETEEERRKKREKTIFYLRHKLQKGLISREKPPQPEEMTDMDSHLEVLEKYTDLEPEIIRETKVNKLLKVILKLGTIPRDAELKFKERCTKLLGIWTDNLNAAEEKAKEQSSNSVTNGKVEEDKKPEAAKSSTEPLVNGNSEADAEPKAEPATNAGAETAKEEIAAEAT